VVAGRALALLHPVEDVAAAPRRLLAERTHARVVDMPRSAERLGLSRARDDDESVCPEQPARSPKSCDNRAMNRTIVSVGAAALLAACTMAARAATPAAAPTAKAGGAAANAACALVTKAEAETILGGPLDELEGGVGDSCHYGHKPDKPYIFMTELRSGQTKATFDAETKNVAKAMRKPIKPARATASRRSGSATFRSSSCNVARRSRWRSHREGRQRPARRVPAQGAQPDVRDRCS
jgi:hypothetical protein